MESSNKILFLDIDGPMIPGRAYMYPDRIDGIFYSKFDPVAVAMINNVCEERGWKVVLHSSWIKILGGAKTYKHCVEQGIKEEHLIGWCDETENWRYTRVAKYLADHSEVTHYVVIDDIKYEDDLYAEVKHPTHLKDHVMQVSFDDGLLMDNWRDLLHDEMWKLVQ